MRKLSVLLLLAAAVGLQFCSSSKKAKKSAMASVTYNANIKPIIEASCAPCHIAGKGKKKPLDNYADASSSVTDIIERVQKNPGDRGFMPMNHPKLSDEQIALFTAWKNGGLKEN